MQPPRAAHRVSSETNGRRRDRSVRPFKAGRVYRMRLNGPEPARVAAIAVDVRPPDLARGEAIMRGRWRFDTSRLRVEPDRAPWGPGLTDSHFSERVHRFSWLRDVAALGPSGAEHARVLALAWTRPFGKWDDVAWRVGITAERVVNWLAAAPCIFEPLGAEPAASMLDSLGRQLRHLRISAVGCAEPEVRFKAAVALSLAGAAMPDVSGPPRAGIGALERECRAQILADGGHASRSPQALAEALMDLDLVARTLETHDRTVPGWMAPLRERMARMLRFLAVPGGHLVAHGGNDGRRGLTAAALKPHAGSTRPLAVAPGSGYLRIDAGRLCVLLDGGEAPAPEFAALAHAGCLALAVSDGEDPIVTACGSHTDSTPDWRAAARRTAAHSVLCLEGCDSAGFSPRGPLGIDVPTGPARVSSHRRDEANHYLVEARHCGWLRRFGLACRRRLFVARDGAQLIGEESLSRPAARRNGLAGDPVRFAIRLHLHPDVAVVEAPDRGCLYLGLERGRRVWRFRSDGAVSVEPSVYAAGGSRLECRQIVLRGEADPTADGDRAPNRVRWALNRVSGHD